MELIDLIRKFLLNYKYVNKENVANNDNIKLKVYILNMNSNLNKKKEKIYT